MASEQLSLSKVSYPAHTNLTHLKWSPQFITSEPIYRHRPKRSLKPLQVLQKQNPCQIQRVIKGQLEYTKLRQVDLQESQDGVNRSLSYAGRFLAAGNLFEK